MSGQGSTVSAPTAPMTRPVRTEYAQGWSRTEMARPVAVWLSLLFGLGLVAVPLVDGLLGSWRDPWQQAGNGLSRILHQFGSNAFTWSGVADSNDAALGAIQSFETSLEDSSAIAEAVRPAVLDRLLRWGGAGSEEAYVGRDGWLYYRPDVDALIMAGQDGNTAARGIVDFATELAARGVRLVVIPIPGKASIHPEQLAVPGSAFVAPPIPPAVSTLASEVSSAAVKKTGVLPSFPPRVVDATSILWSQRSGTGADQYLRTDSHWTPGAMQAVARAAASMVGEIGIEREKEEMRTEKRSVSAVGDTALMNNLPASSPLMGLQSVEAEAVLCADGKEWRADSSSPVLVLGDSYTNIFSSKDLGWGTSAGLAEHLSLALGYRVDKLARNDAGAKSAREMLAAEDARRPGWLDGKKVVVWVMAAREFVRGDWSAVALAGREEGAVKNFFVVPPGQSFEVEAQVKSMGNLPAGTGTPYADYLTAIHLTGLRDTATGREIGAEALAYVFTMRNRRIEIPHGLDVGSRIKLRLSSYAEKSDKLDSLNRGELDDLDVMMEEPNFAEWPDSQY